MPQRPLGEDDLHFHDPGLQACLPEKGCLTLGEVRVVQEVQGCLQYSWEIREGWIQLEGKKPKGYASLDKAGVVRNKPHLLGPQYLLQYERGKLDEFMSLISH